MFKKTLYRRKLKKAREDLQLIFDHAHQKRLYHPDGPYREIEDFMTDRERRVFIEVKQEEWALSKLVGEDPQWGSAKILYTNEEDETVPAATNVKYDRSTKLTIEWDEDAGVYWMLFNGEKRMGNRRIKDEEGNDVLDELGDPKTEPYPLHYTKDRFESTWKYDEKFHDAMDAWYEAKTDEEKQAVIDKYKEENGIR